MLLASALLASNLLSEALAHAQDNPPACAGTTKDTTPAEHARCWFERANQRAKECADGDSCLRHAITWCENAALDDPRVANACFLSLVRTAQLEEASQLAEYLSDPTPGARRCQEALASVATLRVVSNPSGGIVKVNERTYGPAPTEVRLSVPWWNHEATVTFGDTKVKVSQDDIIEAFDDRACEMTDLVVEGPGAATGSPGNAPPSSTAVPTPQQAARQVEGTEANVMTAGAAGRSDAASAGGVHTRWWFWTTVGVVAAAAVIGGVLVATSSDDVHRLEPIPGDDREVHTALAER